MELQMIKLRLIGTLMFCLLLVNVQAQTCTITGIDSLAVNGTQNFSTQTTSGASYFWSVTGGLSIEGSNTGSSVSVKGTSAGSGQVCVNRFKAGEAPCCNCKTVTVICTAPSLPEGISGPNYNLCRQSGHPQEEGTYYVYNPVAGVTYHWEFVRNTGASISLGSGLSVTINASIGFYYASGAGSHTLRVRAFYCGQYSEWYSSTIVFQNCSMGRMAVYPNPVSDELNIAYENDSVTLTGSVKGLQFSIVNSDQEKVYSGVITEKTITVPVNKLPEGTYYVIINNKEGVVQKRILIER